MPNYRSSLHSSHLVYQFSPVSGKLLTYEIYSYSKNVTMIEHKIQPFEHKIASVSWINDCNLLLCDTSKNVYIISSDGKKIQIIISGDSIVDEENKILTLPFNNGFVMVDNNSLLTVSILLFHLRSSENVLHLH